MQTYAGAGKHILVVDDEPGVREVMTQVLRMDGHSVSEAGDGAEALELFSHDPFDLVITDYEMPRMKGDELVDRVRRLIPRQRIIMVSGSWPMLAESPRNVDRCLNKPFQLKELLLAVRHALQDGQ